MKAELLHDTEATPGKFDLDNPTLIRKDDGKYYWPKGHIIEDPRAFRLVQMGVAVPADNECTFQANMTTKQMAAAQRQQEMVAKGIHPDDYQLYLDGKIVGYQPDGSYEKGPNWEDDEEDWESPLILPERYDDDEDEEENDDLYT